MARAVPVAWSVGGARAARLGCSWLVAARRVHARHGAGARAGTYAVCVVPRLDPVVIVSAPDTARSSRRCWSDTLETRQNGNISVRVATGTRGRGTRREMLMTGNHGTGDGGVGGERGGM